MSEKAPEFVIYVPGSEQDADDLARHLIERARGAEWKVAIVSMARASLIGTPQKPAASSYISPALPDMIRGLYKGDYSPRSIQSVLDLAAELVEELIDMRAAAGPLSARTFNRDKVIASILSREKRRTDAQIEELIGNVDLVLKHQRLLAAA